VSERAAALIRSAVDDPQDPFSLARLDGEALADIPERLVEEVHTIPLFGGRRAVWVKAGNRSIAGAVETLLAAPPVADCRVVIEAGDLKRTAPLRALCEKAKSAVAIACYPDEARDIARLIDDELRQSSLTISADARAMLAGLVGADRLGSRSEVGKLALYAHGRGEIGIDDVLAVVADASAIALDATIDAALAGRTQEVETQFARARAAGTPANVIAGGALRHAMQLHRAKLAIEAGESVDAALASLYVHFRRKAAVEDALRAWSAQRLESLIAQFASVVLESRRTAGLADAIVQRALLSTAVTARRKA
jgi:DNA polymerase-3 subunit delta